MTLLEIMRRVYQHESTPQTTRDLMRFMLGKEHPTTDWADYLKKSNEEVNYRFYMEYLDGKNIILVGPAGYVKGQGENIDKFEVVVRVNCGYPPTPDYGTKTDVIYYNGLMINKMTESTRLECEWLITKRPAKYAAYMKPTCVTLEKHFIQGIKEQLVSNTNTGVLALLHLLTSKARTVHTIGMDFYRTGYYDGYDGVANGSLVGEPDGHDINGQIEILRGLKDERFRPDEALRRVLYGEEGGNRRVRPIKGPGPVSG